MNAMIAIQSYASYATSGFLVLFYTYSVEQGGLGLSKEFAGNMMAYIGTVASLLPLLGAYLTDKYIGMQRAISIRYFIQCYWFFYLQHLLMGVFMYS